MQIIKFIQSILDKSSPDVPRPLENLNLNNVLPASLFVSMPSIPSVPSLPTITSFIEATFWKYLHFTPFIIILWPFLLTLLFSLTSASTWVFWLFTSIIFGIIQLIYVLYQFVMISIDLGVLSVLKTYTSMRSIVRYYTIRSGNIGKSGKDRRRSERRRDDEEQYVNKPGRKRQWRKKLDAAKSLRDFLQIEIQEPPPLSLDLNHIKTTDYKNGTKKKPPLSPPSSASSSSRKRMGIMGKLNSRNRFTSNDDITLTSSSSSPSLIPPPPNLSLITARTSKSSFTSSTGTIMAGNNRSISQSSFHRSQSSIGFNDHDRSLSSSSFIINHDEIEKELGMTGSMLLQTTCRLRETRMQASSTYTYQNSTTYLSFLRQTQQQQQQQQQDQQVYYEGHGGSGIGCASRSESRGGSINESEEDDEDEGHNHEASNIENSDNDCSDDNSVGKKTTSPLSSPAQQQENNAASQLKFLLQGVVKRNHLSINDLLIQDALSVMECGRHYLSEQSRNVILSYHEEVEHCLKWISQIGLEKQQYCGSGADIEDSGPTSGMSNSINNNNNSNHNNSSNAEIKLYKELSDRLNLIRKLKHNMGRTALMLSGGGAQAMYHLGTIKALCESKLYDDIGVISGTSGGSITAAMCAIKTRSELLKDVCVPHVSTDFGLTGEMKEKNIRWFPRVVQMGEYWLKHKLMVDSKEFKRCCDFYFGDITFEEAFERTGKHVCITVSASRTEESSGGGSGGADGAQRLLLNHISTPHVTLASAVAASCALPGVMAPAKLVTKNNDSKQELFEVDGVEWIDGSVQADLPFKRISTLFNVSNYIVCQTNFHVLPFLHKAHHPNTKSFYWRAFQTCEWDIRNRALNLSRLGLFPKIFGQDISKVFKQKYHGDLTLVPRFTTMQVFGLKALVNPTYEDMEVYLQNGQSSAWPYLSVIREMLRLETAIDKCIKSLNERIDHLSPESDWDDVESFTSATTSRYRTLGARRENELLKQKVHSLELENLEMKKQLELMQNKFGIKVAGSEHEALHPISTPTGQIEFVRSEQSLASERKNTRHRLWKKD